MPRGPNDYVFFWKPEQEHGWASQWYESPFFEQAHPNSKHFLQNDGIIIFQTAEHYMMYHKAVLFRDYLIADEILETGARDTARVKQLGKQVKGFDEHIWNEKRWEIVKRGNVLKFDQHEDLKRKLLETGRDTALVEASPFDRIWGIGKTKERALQSLNSTNEWGLNLLGRILEEVRTELRERDAAAAVTSGSGGGDSHL